MKPALFSLAIAAVLATASASAQTPGGGGGEAPSPAGQAQFGSGTPSNFLSFEHSPYVGPDTLYRAGQCFDGKRIVGANRSGAEVLYLQGKRGPIWRMRLAGACEALDSAQKLTVRSPGGRDFVCAKARATLVVQTAAGSRRCKIEDPRPLTRQDIALLSAARRR